MSSKKNKIKYNKYLIIFIASFVLLLLVAFIGSWNSFKFKDIKTVLRIGNASLPSSSEEMKLAKEMFNWIDLQRDKKGIYLVSRICDQKKQCNNLVLGKNSGFSVLWSRYRNYKKTMDNNQLEAIKMDLNNYSKAYDTEKIMNNHYDCFLMYDLYKDSVFNEKEKETIKRMCFDAEFSTGFNPFAYETYKEIPAYYKDATKKEDVDKLTESVNQKMALILSGKKTEKIVFDQVQARYPQYVTELATKVTWTGEGRYLNSAMYFFDISLKQYLGLDVEIESAQRSATGLAALNLYKINKDENYLKLAKYIYDRERDNSLTTVMSALEYQLLAEQLSSVTGSSGYVKNRADLNKFLAKNYLHRIEYQGDKSKDQSVLYAPGVKSINQDIIPNALFSGLIIQ